MIIAYSLLRWRIFREEIQEFIRQVKNLGIFVFIFLGIAFPAAIFAMFLGYGVVLRNAAPVHQSLLIICLALMLQVVMLDFLKPAVLGTPYAKFLDSLQASKRFERMCTCALSLLCQPLVLIHAFILANIDLNRWGEIPHGLLFLVLQLLSGIIVLINPISAYLFLSLSFAYVLLIMGLESIYVVESLVDHLLVLCLLYICVLGLEKGFGMRISGYSRLLPIEYKLWVKILLSNKANLLFLLCIVMMICSLSAYSVFKMPQYHMIIYLLGAHLITICCASTQLLISRAIAAHPLFFSSGFMHPKITYFQWTLAISLGVFALSSYAILMQTAPSLASLLTLLVLIAFAKYTPKLFFAGAALTSLLLTAYMYL